MSPLLQHFKDDYDIIPNWGSTKLEPAGNIKGYNEDHQPAKVDKQ